MKKTSPNSTFPYGKRNAFFFFLGFLSILTGYLSLSQPPVDGFLSLTLAPLLLSLGYFILIPIALLLKKNPDA